MVWPQLGINQKRFLFETGVISPLPGNDIVLTIQPG
jgi:hypothetical protein